MPEAELLLGLVIGHVFLQEESLSLPFMAPIIIATHTRSFTIVSW